MSIERKSEIFSVESFGDGSIGVKVAKLLVENGEVIHREWHRFMVTPEVDAADQMGLVNAHLELMGLPALSEAEMNKVHSVCDTNEVRAEKRSAYLVEQAAAVQEAQLEG